MKTQNPPAEKTQQEPRFETSDAPLAAYIWAFHTDKILALSFRQGKFHFLFDIDESQGRFYKMEFNNSPYKKYEEHRKRVIDMVHDERKKR